MGTFQERHLRSFVKAVTWRITGSIDTFVLSLLITGSLKLAGGIAGTETITKIVLFYAHERAWHFVPWGRRHIATEPSPQPVAAPVVAQERHIAADLAPQPVPVPVAAQER